jgi:hypothetical protein
MPSLIQVTAYSALMIFPFHVLAHRIVPMDPTPPISAFSPSEMSFEFVKAQFVKYPTLTWLSYPLLAGFVLFHAAEGAAIITRWFTGSAPSRRLRRGIAGMATIAVVCGLYKITQEPLMLRRAQSAAVDGIFEQGFPVYRWLGISGNPLKL